ncbi:MAG TPA: hypothetical protein ENJ18_15900 [Nannocystis exedens]|nr:hypothetical protein [Nannocystis exedens]
MPASGQADLPQSVLRALCTMGAADFRQHQDTGSHGVNAKALRRVDPSVRFFTVFSLFDIPHIR